MIVVYLVSKNETSNSKAASLVSELSKKDKNVSNLKKPDRSQPTQINPPVNKIFYSKAVSSVSDLQNRDRNVFSFKNATVLNQHKLTVLSTSIH